MEKSREEDPTVDRVKLELLSRIEAIANRDVDDAHITEELSNYLKHRDPEIAAGALQATWNFVENEPLFREVLFIAKTHRDEDVRGTAQSSLGAIIRDGLAYELDLPTEGVPSPAKVKAEFYAEVKEHLLARVDAPMESMEVRRRCVEALGYLSYKTEIRNLILRFYHQAPNPWVRVSAIYAMCLVRDPVFERLVLEALYDEDSHVLMEAIHSTGCLELHAAEARLVELSASEDLDLRYEAIVALGHAGATERMQALFQVLEKRYDDEDSREALQLARQVLQQREKLGQGEELWDDGIILGEIEDMITDSNEPNG